MDRFHNPMSLLASALSYHRWWLNLIAFSFICSAIVPLPNRSAPLHAQIDNSGPAVSTIQRIRNRGNLMIVGVAYDYAPFSAVDADGTVVGFEPELVRALAEIWDIQVTFVPVAPTARLQSLLAGQVDLIAAALPHTAANEAIVDFSTHYFTDTNALLMPVDSQALAFSALSGRTVATVQDDGALAQLDAYLRTTDATVTLLPFQEHGAALRALAAGQADALLDNYTYLTDVAATQSDLSVIVPLPGKQAFGFGLAPGDSFFRDLVDATLQQIYTTGRYAEIYSKWFPTQPVPILPELPGHWPYTIADLPVTMGTRQGSLLEQLRRRGTLRAGVRYDMPPFGFLDTDGTIQGFEIDLIHEFAQRWFGDPDAVILVRVTPDTAIPLLNADQIDLLASAFPDNWSNEALVDVSLPYYADGLGVLVQTDAALSRLTDLNGKTLATVDGVDARVQIATLLDTTAQPLLMPFQEYRTAEQALLAGQIDGLIGSTTVLSQVAANNSALRLLPEAISAQSYGIALPTFDDELRDLVNLTLQAMQLDGTYDAIYSKWFPEPHFAIAVWPGITADLPLSLVPDQDLQSLVLQPTLLPAQVPAAATLVPTATLLPVVVPTATLLPTVAVTALPTLAVLPTVAAIPIVATASPTVESFPLVTATPASAGPSTILVPTTIPVSETAIALPTARSPLATTLTTTPAAKPVTVTVTSVVTGPTVSLDVQAGLPTTVTVLSNVNINARARPTTDAAILTVVSGGSSLTALLLSADGEWVSVALPSGLRGWVARRFLLEAEQLESSATAPAVVTPTRTPLARTSTPATIITATPTLAVIPPPGANGATSAAQSSAAATTHRITATDSLASIAQQYYGEQRLWTLIYEANRALIGDNPSIIPVGIELVIPPRP